MILLCETGDHFRCAVRMLIDENDGAAMEWLGAKALRYQDHGTVPLKDFETHGHHEKLCFCSRNLANASKSFLPVAFPQPRSRNAIAYFHLARTQIAQE